MQPANSYNWQMPFSHTCQITDNLVYFVKQPSHPRRMLHIKADLNKFHALHYVCLNSFMV
jgi:hypothetical protein